MPPDLTGRATARALRYLELRGVAPSPGVRARVAAIVREALAAGENGLLDRVFAGLLEAWGPVEPAGACCPPPLHRGSMGYPEP